MPAHPTMTIRCPRCQTKNLVETGTLDLNEEVGAEMWGRCSNCGQEFQVIRPLDVNAVASRVLVSYRTPRVTPFVFHMLKPIRQPDHQET